MSVPRPLAAPEDESPRAEGADGDEEEGVENERDTMVVPLDDETPPEFDDELPTDPNFGIDLPSELDTGETDAPTDLPIGPDFAPAEDAGDELADDSLGFAGTIDAERSFREADDPKEPEAGDGFENEKPALAETALPSLDGDDGPELDDVRFGPGLGSADEASLPQAEKPWSIDFLTPDREHCSALGAGRGVVVAGSNDLFWLDEGRETVVRIGLDGTRISSIAIVGEGQTTALSVTAFGRLLRRARAGGDVERLVEWRRVAEASGSSPEGLELRGLGSAHPSSVLGRLTSGRLVRSDDMGSTFRMIEPEITTLTLSSSGDPVAVIARDGTRLGLSSDGGARFDFIELVSPAREVASGEAPLVAAAGSVVVLGDAERGIVVSPDGGRTFRKVRGATNVTAVTAGSFGGRFSAFAALYRETEDRSLLVEIDAETAIACTGAVLGLPAADDPDVALELGRVERLLWEAERLWAAGAFGLAMIRLSR